MIVTIDGPAGAGKSSVAKSLAKRLGFRFLDTGAMYRAVALAGSRCQVDWQDEVAVASLTRQVSISFEQGRVLLDGEDITEAIRQQKVTANVRYIADNAQARAHLVEVQRTLGHGGNVVTEGRDQGTVAFPDAECKVFLTASPEERARRRVKDLLRQGETTCVQQVLDQQNQRDHEDVTRKVGALVAAADSVEVQTDGLEFEQVVDQLEKLVRSRMTSNP